MMNSVELIIMPSLPATNEQERAAKAWIDVTGYLIRCPCSRQGNAVRLSRHTGMDCRYPDDKDVTLKVIQNGRVPYLVIVAVVAWVNKNQGHAVVLNLSGGTKIMSLAAYQAAVSAGIEMLYVNTERGEIISFDRQGNATGSKPFTAKISIETQLRAAGRELKQNPSKPMLRPADIRPDWANFSAFLVDRYETAYNKFIRKVLDQVHADGSPAWGRRVPVRPLGQSAEAAKQAHEIKLWNWDQTENTITIKDQQAFEFLNGGWVEIFALLTLCNSRHFDEVLANVQVEDFAGEMDVVATLNGRLGIIECKTEGPANEDRKARLIAKHRLHEHMFGGLYAKAILALPSDNRIRDWKKLCDQYELAHPIHSHELKDLANKMYRLLNRYKR